MAPRYGKTTKVRAVRAVGPTSRELEARMASNGVGSPNGPPIPDRIGDQYQQRASQKQQQLAASRRYQQHPERYGQDGGPSLMQTPYRQPLPNSRQGQNIRKRGWRSGGDEQYGGNYYTPDWERARKGPRSGIQRS